MFVAAVVELLQQQPDLMTAAVTELPELYVVLHWSVVRKQMTWYHYLLPSLLLSEICIILLLQGRNV